MASKTLTRFVLGLAVALLATIALLVVVWEKASGVSNEIAANAHATCVIQQKGLPITTAFVKVFEDAHILSTLPQGRMPRPTLTPTQAHLEAATAQDLRKNLAIAAQAEKLLPKSRRC